MDQLVLKTQLDKIMVDNLYPNSKTLLSLAKRQNSSITMKQIQEYLSNQKAYQLTKERKITKKSMGHVVSFSPWSLVQMDLLDMSRFSYDYSQYKSKKKMSGVSTEFNKGYKFILIIIDVFSRYVDAVMIKSKNIEDCVNALEIILDFNKIKPDVLMSDSESSFLSEKFQNFLAKKQIIHDVVVLDDHHALSVLDRFCRTLRGRLNKLFLGRGTTEWVNDLSKIIYQYNNTEHRGILNFTPTQVLNNAKIQEVIMELNHEKNKKNVAMKETDKFKVGDKVRVFIKDKFKKGSDPSYTAETFKIIEKNGKNYTLSNNKTYVKNDLQKIFQADSPNNNLLLGNGEEEEDEDINPFEEVKKQNKIAKKLKKENLVRPTFDQLNEKRESRNKKIDFVKLSKGL